ncbi:MAG: hypothetical protein OEN56_02890 [Gemmatimonadota bacterium]|nr:hypothetical protein [Gemmatimonadota bacterium]
MSVGKVLKLADHRDRRLQRSDLVRAMACTDRTREALLGLLASVAEVAGSDRVAAVWIDEYGPGLVHPHLVLDLLADAPRRLFPAEPLQKAWDFGIPGTYDNAASFEADRSATFAVALGSDGARAWFLVADSLTRRAPLGESGRGRLMFLAGECSAIVLHRDLEAEAEGGPVAFAGWHVLKDLEGHETDPVRSGIVGRRFEVARLIRMFVDEDLTMPDERRADLADRARGSLRDDPDLGEPEAALLGRALDAFTVADLHGLAEAAQEMGQEAERLDHVSSALALYDCAYDIGFALVDAGLTAEAARASGRVLRRRGRWAEADRAYGVALSIAERSDLHETIARTRAGLAVIHKDRGDLAAARAGFAEALEAAQSSHDADTVASIYHDLMGLEHAAGELPLASRYGWRAVNTYRSDVGRTRCLVSFALILKELGDIEAAEDAYEVVCGTSDELYYLIYAHDALAHLAALRGDAAQFDRRAAACDALGWESGPLSAKAEILWYRGLSHQLLGRGDEARSWLRRAIDFAREHGFTRVRMGAEEALRALSGGPSSDRPSTMSAPPEVRDGLRAMRHRFIGA